MRTGVKVEAADEQRRRLEVIAAEVGTSKPTDPALAAAVHGGGLEGLLRDKTRKSGNPPTSEKKVREHLTLALGRPPDGETHWTVRALAKKVGIGGRRRTASLSATRSSRIG